MDTHNIGADRGKRQIKHKRDYTRLSGTTILPLVPEELQVGPLVRSWHEADTRLALPLCHGLFHRSDRTLHICCESPKHAHTYISTNFYVRHFRLWELFSGHLI